MLLRFVMHFSSFLHIAAAMAEWLRRWTRNPMGSPRAGSNPARSDFFLEIFLKKMFQPRNVCCSQEASSKWQHSLT